MSRTKLDANREIKEAAQNDPIAMDAWETFHNYIEISKEEMGRGILFDIHKYEWTTAWAGVILKQPHLLHLRQGNRPCLEIGYLLSKTDLNNEEYDTEKSSIRQLGIDTQQFGEQLFMGPDSFGAYLANRGAGQGQGACSVPSPNNPYPSNGDECWVDGCVPCDCRAWDGKNDSEETFLVSCCLKEFIWQGYNLTWKHDRHFIVGSCTAGSCDYFNGGYITYTHGSRNGGTTDAMQLETRVPDFDHLNCGSNCEDAEDYYVKDGTIFGKAIVDFYLKYYA